MGAKVKNYPINSADSKKNILTSFYGSAVPKK